MTLYIRKKPGWINFIHNIQEFREFISFYIPERHIVIGDISQFSKQMRNMLLKFIEDNNMVDCYSSQDIVDPVLLSRFPNVVKDPITYTENILPDQFLTSDRSYLSAIENLSHLSDEYKLLAPLLNQKLLSLIV